MKKNSDNSINSIAVKDSSYIETFGNNNSIYTHAVFCQCILPIRTLPQGINYYEVKHGNASLMIQSGVMWDEKGKAVQMEVPSGSKARLLLPYIIDQATRTGNPEINMGANLYQFMLQNNIPIGGRNRKELQRQVNNIAASSINLGIWGETETHRYSSQESYRIASKLSFWTEKELEQLNLWNPTLVLSDKFMSTLTDHMVLLDIKPLIELQDKPKAMDMYMWLSYRIRNIKYAVKISYEDLHNIFGIQTKSLNGFKRDFKTAIKHALPYVLEADVDLESDKNHIILKNNKNKLYIPGKPNFENIQESGVFGELRLIGLPESRIKKLSQETTPEQIKRALEVTKESINKGKVTNPAGFFTAAVQQGWDFSKNQVEDAKEEAKSTSDFDNSFEDNVENKDWKKIRKQFAEIKGVPIFNSWIKQVEFENREGNSIILSTPTRFITQSVKDSYGDLLLSLWQKIYPEIKELKIKVKK